MRKVYQYHVELSLAHLLKLDLSLTDMVSEIFTWLMNFVVEKNHQYDQFDHSCISLFNSILFELLIVHF